MPVILGKPVENVHRVWDMPNSCTFKIPAVRGLLREYVTGGEWCDPFANANSPAVHTNDINPEMPTTSHMDAFDYLKGIPAEFMDGILLDPPYSMRQIVEKYNGYGKTLQIVPVLDEAARVVAIDGIAISFGWNSNGLGKSRGFSKLQVLYIAHGGQHNDTIVTVERKTDRQKNFPFQVDKP